MFDLETTKLYSNCNHDNSSKCLGHSYLGLGKISNLIRYPVFSAKKSYQMEFLYHLTGQSSFLHLDKTNM